MNEDAKDIAECIWHLSTMLMNGDQNSDNQELLVSTIETLSTMLAKWYHIK